MKTKEHYKEEMKKDKKIILWEVKSFPEAKNVRAGKGKMKNALKMNKPMVTNKIKRGKTREPLGRNCRRTLSLWKNKRQHTWNFYAKR